MNVSGIEKKDDSRLVLTIDGKAENVNAAAELINEKKLVIDGSALSGGNGLSVDLVCSGASFYPVFDYVGEAGDKLEFTLILQSRLGEFAEGISAESVTFADGFEGAADVELTRTSGLEAELKFKIPANGMTAENVEVEGTVGLKEGSLNNKWGESQKETSYTRGYNQSGMGKDLSNVDLALIENHVNAVINTPMSYVTGGASALASVGSAVYSILEVTGVIESEKAKLDDIRNRVKELQSSVKSVQNAIAAVDLKLDVHHSQDIVSNFRDQYISKFEETNSLYYEFLSKVRLLAAAHPDLIATNNYKNNAAFCALVVKDDPNLVSQIKTLTNDLCNKLINRDMKVGLNDPIAAFDELMACTYNFDSQTYSMRMGYHSEILSALENAFDIGVIIQVGEAELNKPDDANEKYEAAVLQRANELKDSIEKAKASVRKNLPAKFGTVKNEYADTSFTDKDGYGCAVYCYTISSYVYSNSFSGNWSADHGGSIGSETTVSVFASKMRGKTVLQELEDAKIKTAKLKERGCNYISFKGYVRRSGGDKECYWDVLNIDKKNPAVESYTTYYYKDGWAFFPGKIKTDRHVPSFAIFYK